jgi:AcrR family transcriptional regulator
LNILVQAEAYNDLLSHIVDLKMEQDDRISDHILDIAERAFRQHGPDWMSLSGVARELKVPKAILSFYVPGDPRLREGIVGRRLDQILAQLPPISDAATRATAEIRLCAAMNALVRLSRIFQREDPALFAVYHSLSHEQASVITKFQGDLIRKFEVIIARGIQAREFTDCDPWHASWATLNAIAPFYDPRFGHDWSAPGEHRAYKHARALAVQGLAAVVDATSPQAEAQRRAAQALGLILGPDRDGSPNYPQ